MKTVKPLIFLAIIMMLFIVSGCGNTSNSDTESTLDTNSVAVPWEDSDKQPKDYTYEEFEALTAEQQLEFQESFETIDEFNEWLNEAQWVPVDVPWDDGGKSPSEYTWEEFEALSDEQQIAFQNSFEDNKDFEEWYYKVSPSS